MKFLVVASGVGLYCSLVAATPLQSKGAVNLMYAPVYKKEEPLPKIELSTSKGDTKISPPVNKLVPLHMPSQDFNRLNVEVTNYHGNTVVCQGYSDDQGIEPIVGAQISQKSLARRQLSEGHEAAPSPFDILKAWNPLKSNKKKALQSVMCTVHAPELPADEKSSVKKTVNLLVKGAQVKAFSGIGNKKGSDGASSVNSVDKRSPQDENDGPSSGADYETQGWDEDDRKFYLRKRDSFSGKAAAPPDFEDSFSDEPATRPDYGDSASEDSDSTGGGDQFTSSQGEAHDSGVNRSAGAWYHPADEGQYNETDGWGGDSSDTLIGSDAADGEEGGDASLDNYSSSSLAGSGESSDDSDAGDDSQSPGSSDNGFNTRLRSRSYHGDSKHDSRNENHRSIAYDDDDYAAGDGSDDHDDGSEVVGGAASDDDGDSGDNGDIGDNGDFGDDGELGDDGDFGDFGNFGDEGSSDEDSGDDNGGGDDDGGDDDGGDNSYGAGDHNGDNSQSDEANGHGAYAHSTSRITNVDSGQNGTYPTPPSSDIDSGEENSEDDDNFDHSHPSHQCQKSAQTKARRSALQPRSDSPIEQKCTLPPEVEPGYSDTGVDMTPVNNHDADSGDTEKDMDGAPMNNDNESHGGPILRKRASTPESPSRRQVEHIEGLPQPQQSEIHPRTNYNDDNQDRANEETRESAMGLSTGSSMGSLGSTPGSDSGQSKIAENTGYEHGEGSGVQNAGAYGSQRQNEVAGGVNADDNNNVASNGPPYASRAPASDGADALDDSIYEDARKQVNELAPSGSADYPDPPGPGRLHRAAKLSDDYEYVEPSERSRAKKKGKGSRKSRTLSKWESELGLGDEGGSSSAAKNTVTRPGEPYTIPIRPAKGNQADDSSSTTAKSTKRKGAYLKRYRVKWGENAGPFKRPTGPWRGARSGPWWRDN